jgi:hypothetical protein
MFKIRASQVVAMAMAMAMAMVMLEPTILRGIQGTIEAPHSYLEALLGKKNKKKKTCFMITLALHQEQICWNQARLTM